MKRWISSILLASTVCNATGCGTIFHGKHQDMPVTISPPGTEVAVYRWSGDVVGGPERSPGKMTVQRPKGHQPYLMRASKEGYCPKYWLTTSSTTGGAWSYLWLVFVPALGPILVGVTLAAVDSSTGGCCAVDPDTVEGALEEDAACAQ